MADRGDIVDQGRQQGAVDTGAGFVGQDGFAARHHRTAQLDQLLLTARQVAGEFVGKPGEIEKGHDLVGARADRRIFARHPAAAEPRGEQVFAVLVGRHHHQVFAHVHAVEHVGNL